MYLYNDKSMLLLFIDNNVKGIVATSLLHSASTLIVTFH